MALKSGRVGIHPSQVDPITGMLIGGTGGASIDDTTIASDKTWSSQKINTELGNKQDTLTAGSNITIQNNVISSTASGGVLPLIKITATSGETVTLTKGQTVITATEVSSGNYEAEVPEFGTYTVSDGTDSTTVTVDTVKIYEVEIIPTPSVISVTLTLYSATEDQVTVVDEDGTHLEQFASGQSSKSITVKVLPSGSNVTFTSSIAKNPSDLSEYYTKTVNVTSATTEVYCMPDNCLYWYGYKGTNFGGSMSDQNWSKPSGKSWGTYTENVNYIYLSTGANQFSGVVSENTVSASKIHLIADSLSLSSADHSGAHVAGASSKSTSAMTYDYFAPQTGLAHEEITVSGNVYAVSYNGSSSAGGHSSNVYALWYD